MNKFSYIPEQTYKVLDLRDGEYLISHVGFLKTATLNIIKVYDCINTARFISYYTVNSCGIIRNKEQFQIISINKV